MRAMLDLTAFSPHVLAAVARMADRGRLWHAASEYGRKQEACGQLLREACHALWPKRKRSYSLYSCRHQATSLFKAELKPREVAAILGHTVSSTMVSYGKRKQAWSVDSRLPPPLPVPEFHRRCPRFKENDPPTPRSRFG